MGRQHDRSPVRDFVDVVYEYDPDLFEGLDYPLVVNDLVVAVDGRVEDPHHPGESFDSHLDPGAESSWLGEQHFLRHDAMVEALVNCDPYARPSPYAVGVIHTESIRTS